MKVTLVYNPSAGKDGVETDDLERLLEQAGHDVRLCDTTIADLDEALSKGADLVLVAGGDGTVGEVLRRIRRPGLPVAICPLGSANNIATAIGHEHTLEEIVGGLGSHLTRPFDVARARGPWGALPFVEGVGFGALACALAAGDASGASGDGSVRFGRAAFRALLEDAEPARLHLELDGRAYKDDFAVIEILNIPLVGPRLRLAPDADPGDGLLDVVCVPFDRCTEMVDWLDDPEAGPPPVTARRATSVRVTCSRSIKVHVDDDFPETGDGAIEVTLGVEAPPVTVVLPPDQAEEEE